MNPTFHIKTEEFIDPAETILLMSAGENFFSYALMKQFPKEIVEFGYYIFSGGEEIIWADFFENNKVLSGPYKQAAIAFNPSETMPVPAEHFKEEEVPLQMDALFGQNFHAVIITENIAAWNLYHVARVPASLHSAVSRRFHTIRSLDINAVLLKKVSPEMQDSMLLDFRTDEFSVLVFKENTLQLLKTFSYSSPEDVLYYLLKISQQTGLSQQEVKIVLAGLIEKDSSIYRELYKYFVHLEFDELPVDISINKNLEECPRHYFSSICKLATCV